MARVLNLNFHGIGSPQGREFGEGERDFWVTPAMFEATLDTAADRDELRLSFDDGNSTDIDVALPALRQRGLTATFFIVPSWLGTPGFIAEDDIRSLADSGMTIGNHGFAHHLWTKLTPEELSREVEEGRRGLERLSRVAVTTLAIPFGDYDDAVLATLRGAKDYEYVFTSDGGPADGEAWLQPREHLRAGHTPADLERLLCMVPPSPTGDRA